MEKKKFVFKEMKENFSLYVLGLSISLFVLAASRLLAGHLEFLILCFVIEAIGVMSPIICAFVFDRFRQIVSFISGMVGPAVVVLVNAFELSEGVISLRRPITIMIYAILFFVCVFIFNVMTKGSRVYKKKELYKMIQSIILVVCISALMVCAPTYNTITKDENCAQITSLVDDDSYIIND